MSTAFEARCAFFGAPAEEIYHGGAYMARDDVDALLFWHPSAVTTVITRSGLAMDSIRFVFDGLASDATDAAAKGVSALAAAYELREFDTARGDAIYESPLPAELGPFECLKPRRR